MMKGISRRRFIKLVGAGAAATAAGVLDFPYVWAQSKEPIVIGHQADLTGFLATYGYFYDKVAKAAIDEINKEGGIAGRPVKYVVEDTASDPPTGVRKLRKLIEAEGADFVIGSVHSGVCIASAPAVKELKTVYFPFGMATEITAEKGNRYLFRLITHVREQIQAAGKWAMENVSKEWTSCTTDYAWGWSHRDWWKKLVDENGGKVLSQINIPVGTKDFLPYLAKIPAETKAIYYATLGADTIGFIRQLREIGYKEKKFGVICNHDGIDLGVLGDAVEGDWTLEYLPRYFSEYNTPYHRKLREYAGLDPNGKEIGGKGLVVTGSHYWSSYEAVFTIKGAVEGSGWKSKKDNPALIEWLEGRTFKEGPGFPQGDILIRAEDHQGFHQHWMSRIEGGKYRIKFRIPKERTMYPPAVDYRKEAF